jgi:hypothetical protein
MNFLQNEDIKVIENFLPKTNQKILEETLFGKYFPWYKSIDTASKLENFKSKNIFDYSQFVHVFYSFRNNVSKIESDFVEIINTNLLNQIGKYFKLNDLNIMRIKANLQLHHKKTTKNSFNNPHTDNKLNHISAIYYVNDSDGDTYFFDNRYKIIKKVTPKKGKIVIFRGDIIHAGGHPFNFETRAVINCNFLI